MPHARWFPRGLCNEAESGSLALRPAQWLAFHQQRRLLPSFRRASRSGRRRLSLHRHTVNSYDRTCTGKTHYRMGCERKHEGTRARQAGFPSNVACSPFILHPLSFILFFLRVLRASVVNSLSFVLGEKSNAMKRTPRPKTAERRRCPWATTEQYIDYHDREWGVPVHDDRTLFRVPYPRRSPGRSELGDDPQETRQLSRGLRPLQSGDRRSVWRK